FGLPTAVALPAALAAATLTLALCGLLLNLLLRLLRGNRKDIGDHNPAAQSQCLHRLQREIDSTNLGRREHPHRGGDIGIDSAWKIGRRVRLACRGGCSRRRPYGLGESIQSGL